MRGCCLAVALLRMEQGQDFFQQTNLTVFSVGQQNSLNATLKLEIDGILHLRHFWNCSDSFFMFIGFVDKVYVGTFLTSDVQHSPLYSQTFNFFLEFGLTEISRQCCTRAAKV